MTDNLKPTNSNIWDVAKKLKNPVLSRQDVAQVVKDTGEVIKTSKFDVVTNLTSLEEERSRPSGDSTFSHQCGLGFFLVWCHKCVEFVVGSHYEGFSPGTPANFLSPQKPTSTNSNSTRIHDLHAKADVASSLNIIINYIDVLIMALLTIFRRFPTIFRRFSKTCPKVAQMFLNIFRKLSKISKDYRRLPTTFKGDPKMLR